MNSIEAWDQRDAKLILEMDNFERDWTHKNPCKQYSKVGYCKHLESAQKRKFGARVKEQLGILSSFIRA